MPLVKKQRPLKSCVSFVSKKQTLLKETGFDSTDRHCGLRQTTWRLRWITELGRSMGALASWACFVVPAMTATLAVHKQGRCAVIPFFSMLRNTVFRDVGKSARQRQMSSMKDRMREIIPGKIRDSK